MADLIKYQEDARNLSKQPKFTENHAETRYFRRFGV